MVFAVPTLPMSGIQLKDALDGLRNTQILNFPALADIIAASNLKAGDVCYAPEGHYIVTEEDLTANTHTVRPLSASTGQVMLAPFSPLPSVSAVLEDTRPASLFETGQLIEVPCVCAYRVASASANNHQLTTAGGVKLYVEPEPEGHLNFTAWGPANDGITDDSALLNQFLTTLRATGRSGVLPQGSIYCADTVYAGGTFVTGQGAPRNISFKTRAHSKLLLGGNPGWSMAGSPTNAQAFSGTVWRDVIFAASGDPVAPIELWDRASYDYQIGLWLGRNHNHLMTVDSGETPAADTLTEMMMEPSPIDGAEPPASGGAGGLTLDNITIEGFSGWGIYAYKLWGLSKVENYFIRSCGGPAAYEMNDDRMGGAICLASTTVDSRFGRGHAYNSNFPDSNHNYRGCGFRTSAIKSDTDALNRLWQPGSYIVLTGFHAEGFARPLQVDAHKLLMIDDCNFSGPRNGNGHGIIQLGQGGNIPEDCRVIMGKNKVYDIDDFYVVHHQCDLGQLVQQDESRTMNLHYWSRVKSNMISRELVDGIVQHKVGLVPEGDLTAAPGGTINSVTSVLPLMQSATFMPGTPFTNKLSSFADSDNGSVTWVSDSGIVNAVNALATTGEK